MIDSLRPVMKVAPVVSTLSFFSKSPNSRPKLASRDRSENLKNKMTKREDFTSIEFFRSDRYSSSSRLFRPSFASRRDEER